MTGFFSRRLSAFTSAPSFNFFIRHYKTIVVTITSLLLGIILLLGWLSARKVKEVVTKDFNQQQLVLAQHAARQVENTLDALKRGLSILSISPSIQYFEKVSIGKRMQITFSSMKEEGIVEIRYLGSNSVTHLVDAKGYRIIRTHPEDTVYLGWARQPEHKGTMLLSDVLAPLPEGGHQSLIMKMALPVWQVSVDETNPVATNNFSGVLVFVFDATALVEKVTKGIRSGKTGYAWVIDNRGTFLYHPEKEFIGKNAFEARKEKKPTISFTLINEIQKKMILTGEEGTSWYISGWHRGREGEMKKLIAYTPIALTETGAQLWSVAVVAPISEVEDAIHSIHVQQISLQAIVVVAILFGGLTIMTLMVNWSKSLENEAGRKTIEYKKSEQRYRSLVEHAEDIIFTTDLDGNFLSINAFGERFFRKPRGSIIGQNVNEIFSPSIGEMILAAIRDIVTDKRGKQVTFLVRVGEREYWLNSNFRRLLDQDGNVYAILGVARDMTDRTKMEEQSFYTEKMASLGTLAAGVAHEINNPLAIILGFTDILKEKYAYEPEIGDILSTMERQGLKAKKVVDNLLTFARRKEHADVEVDMNQCIREVLSVLGNNLLVNKISLKELDLFPELPKVKGDPDELQQVLFNIINNAVYAMKSGGGILSIATQVSDDEKDVEIRISDTGPGIAPAHRARIFDPLFTTKKVGDGTGLGLSVSYGIITRHSGIITFTTQTKDESNQTGTTFFITLPAILTEEGKHAA